MPRTHSRATSHSRSLIEAFFFLVSPDIRVPEPPIRKSAREGPLGAMAATGFTGLVPRAQRDQ